MIRLAVRVAREDAEVVLASLLDLAPSGVEEVDVSPEIVEYAVYGAAGELPELPVVSAAAGEALVEVRTTLVADDWSERWKVFHQPVLVGDPSLGPSVHVRPPWARPFAHSRSTGPGDPTPERVHDLMIDPGQAFGTGAHATTRLCLELMIDLARSGRARGTLCDVGCGSGLLAIAATRLGWDPVVAVDHDRLAVTATRENALANTAPVRVSRCDVRRQAPPPASTMLANLLAPLLHELAVTLGASSRPPEILIASGLLTGEVDSVAAMLGSTLGLAEIRRRVQGEWGAVLLERPRD